MNGKLNILHSTTTYLALLLLLSLNSPLLCLADSTDEFLAAHSRFLSLYRQDIRDITLDYDIESSKDSDDGDLKYDLSTIAFNSEVLFPLSENLALRTGLAYKQSAYDFSFEEGTEFGEPNFDMRLHQGFLRFGVAYYLNPKVLLTTFIDAGVSSDFEDGIGSDTLTHEFEAEVVFEMNPGAQLLFGLRRGYEFEDFSVYPLVGIRLIGTEGRLRLSATLPIEVKMQYRLSEWFDSYALVKFTGAEYEIGYGPGDQKGTLTVMQRRVAAGIQFLPGSTFVLQLEVGAGVDDSLEFDFDNTDSDSRSIDIGPYLSFGIGVSL